MRIGLIDVDSHNFPNLPLMKLSAWHKSQGDSVEWYDPLFHSIGEPFDIVYMSKIFSFTLDFQYGVNCKKLVRGGSGYAISLVDGKEVYDKSKDKDLPYEIEHIYPDYSLYPEMTKDTAYGFLTRGCPRGCPFCVVAKKEGIRSYKVADLSEFWRGQKNIVLCDPNILACKEWEELIQQLINSESVIDFNQGLDIRIMTDKKAQAINKLKIRELRFAWDRYQDKEVILPMFEKFRSISSINQHNLVVYVLCNFDSSFKQDLERVNTLREIGYSPYVMLYDKGNIPKGHRLRKLQRWVNNRFIFWSCPTFEEYLKGSK